MLPLMLAFFLQAAPRFDVASIKPMGPNISYGPGRQMLLGLRYTPTRVYGNTQLFALIEEAWSLKSFQIVTPAGFPNLDVFEIQATMPEGTPRDTVRLMLQTLLAERFNLKFHRETKELASYALVVAKETPKLEAITIEEAKNRKVDTPMGARQGVQSASGPGYYAANGITMENLAGELSLKLQRPVVDATNLTGRYAFTLRWDPQEPEAVAGAIHQCGLKLESRKLPLEVFIVDQIDKVPVGN
jgi:uncharacterized protein (TIGR03435 family)